MPAHLAVLNISPFGEPLSINFLKDFFVNLTYETAIALLEVDFFLKCQPY